VVQEYIVDASVLVQAFVVEPDTKRVRSLLRTLYEKPNPAVLHVPEFCLLECTNILWKQVRFHAAKQAEIQKALIALLNTPLTVEPVTTLLPRALDIGAEYNLAVYDSLYIAMSEQLNHPLITIDQRQSSAAEKVGIRLKLLSDFPEFTD
jgi:predicted nucleic acid-binding protein